MDFPKFFVHELSLQLLVRFSAPIGLPACACPESLHEGGVLRYKLPDLNNPYQQFISKAGILIIEIGVEIVHIRDKKQEIYGLKKGLS
jgi:hypothetical protein